MLTLKKQTPYFYHSSSLSHIPTIPYSIYARPASTKAHYLPKPPRQSHLKPTYEPDPQKHPTRTNNIAPSLAILDSNLNINIPPLSSEYYTESPFMIEKEYSTRITSPHTIKNNNSQSRLVTELERSREENEALRNRCLLLEGKLHEKESNIEGMRRNILMLETMYQQQESIVNQMTEDRARPAQTSNHEIDPKYQQNLITTRYVVREHQDSVLNSTMVGSTKIRLQGNVKVHSPLG